jgi:hypothetical protein
VNINILAAVLRDEVAEALIAEKFDGAFVCHLGTGDLKVKVLALVASNLHGYFTSVGQKVIDTRTRLFDGTVDGLVA